MSVTGVCMMVMNVVPTSDASILIFPFIIGGIVVLGVLFLLVLFLLFRNVSVSRVTGGAVTLTIALIILLSGFWCVTLSPTVTDYRYDTVINSNPAIAGLDTWVASTNFGEGDVMSGSVGAREPLIEPLPEVPSPDGQDVKILVQSFFSFYIYDPTGAVLLEAPNVTYFTFREKAPKSGIYTFQIHNPHAHSITVYVTVSKTSERVYRPLQPLGEWLSLVSLPLIGLGLWAARSKPKQEAS